PNTAIVDENDLSILGEAVDERRVPVVEVPPEVLEHHQRRGGRLLVAEAAVDERYVSDLEREVLGRQLTIRDHRNTAGDGSAASHAGSSSVGEHRQSQPPATLESRNA